MVRSTPCISERSITSDTDIQRLAQLGVNHISQSPPEPWTEWSVDALTQWRERFDRFGVTCEMMHIIGSFNAFRNNGPHIFLGPNPERDREIDRMCEVIRMAAQAGFRGLNYNITILGHLRTPSRTGRGGAVLSSFEYVCYKSKPQRAQR